MRRNGKQEARVDVAALREELIVTEARKKGAAQMYARDTIDAEQLETITAETDQATGKIRAQLSAATARSPLADFAAPRTPAAPGTTSPWAEGTR